MATIDSMKAYAQHINSAMNILGFSDEERKLKLIIEETLLDTDGYMNFKDIREEVKDNKNISDYLKMISDKASRYSTIFGLNNPQKTMEHTILGANFDLIEKAEKIQKQKEQMISAALVNDKIAAKTI